jgi:uncharacterized membrane protein
MTVLQVPPGSPDWAFVAADTILVLHIAGGSIAMVAGAVALVARKGEALHRSAGTVFFLAMLMMAAVGAGVAPFLDDGQRTNTIAGVLTFYLVLTAWTTVMRPDGGVDRFAVLGFFVALGATIAGVLFAMEARMSPTGTIDNSPPQAFLFFIVAGGFAAAGDLKVILRGGISGAPRIARHLWRMCVGLFIAAGSFFLGQQKVMPEFMRGSPWLFVPVLLPLLLMAFWMIRVRLTNWYGRAPEAVGAR